MAERNITTKLGKWIINVYFIHNHTHTTGVIFFLNVFHIQYYNHNVLVQVIHMQTALNIHQVAPYPGADVRETKLKPAKCPQSP